MVSSYVVTIRSTRDLSLIIEKLGNGVGEFIPESHEAIDKAELMINWNAILKLYNSVARGNKFCTLKFFEMQILLGDRYITRLPVIQTIRSYRFMHYPVLSIRK